MRVSRTNDEKPRFPVLVIPVVLAELVRATGTDVEKSIKIPAARGII